MTFLASSESKADSQALHHQVSWLSSQLQMFRQPNSPPHSHTSSGRRLELCLVGESSGGHGPAMGSGLLHAGQPYCIGVVTSPPPQTPGPLVVGTFGPSGGMQYGRGPRSAAIPCALGLE